MLYMLRNLRNWCDFHASSNDDDKVDGFTVGVVQRVVKQIGKIFAEKGDIGLENVSRVSYPPSLSHLHDARFGEIIIFTFIVINVTPLSRFVASLIGAFPLHRVRGAKHLGTELTSCHSLISQRIENLFAWNFVPAFTARCSLPRSMAMNDLFREYPSITLDIIDILGIVPQELAFILEHTNKLVCW